MQLAYAWLENQERCEVYVPRREDASDVVSDHKKCTVADAILVALAACFVPDQEDSVWCAATRCKIGKQRDNEDNRRSNCHVQGIEDALILTWGGMVSIDTNHLHIDSAYLHDSFHAGFTEKDPD